MPFLKRGCRPNDPSMGLPMGQVEQRQALRNAVSARPSRTGAIKPSPGSMMPCHRMFAGCHCQVMDSHVFNDPTSGINSPADRIVHPMLPG